ncbi:ABC transporter permease [Corynebacterium sp. H130]|uniref:ABC transporter permease n=1 Tax=Corynebacterium sp. H130 TaxID=3133444 RepID=UPI0030A7049C
MNLREAIILATGSLKTGKMRSMLTLLGIIIGIASVITILTLGHALKTQTMGSLDSMGINNLMVQVQNREEAKDAGRDYLWSASPVDDPESLISDEHIQQIRSRFGSDITGIGYAGSAGGAGDLHISNAAFGTLADDSMRASVSPVNADYFKLNSIDIDHGRGLSEQDITEARHVTVISPDIFDELFDNDPDRALGAELRFNNQSGSASFMVVGVSAKPKGGLLVGTGSDTRILVPFPLKDLFPQENDKTAGFPGHEQIDIQVAPGVDRDGVKDDLQKFFDAEYQANDVYQVKVSDNSKDMETIQTVLSSISVAVAAIGGISLLVGGIGVMNVMLITVTERTREIGVRKALGARSRDIKLQFVIEAMIVCLIGGLIGVALGSIFGMIGATLLKTFVFPPLAAIVVSLLFSMGIGLFFGYYPAAKAAKMNPIEALRYE